MHCFDFLGVFFVCFLQLSKSSPINNILLIYPATSCQKTEKTFHTHKKLCPTNKEMNDCIFQFWKSMCLKSICNSSLLLCLSQAAWRAALAGARCSACICKAGVRGAGAGGHQFSSGARYHCSRGRAGCREAAAELYFPGGLHCWQRGVLGIPV